MRSNGGGSSIEKQPHATCIAQKGKPVMPKSQLKGKGVPVDVHERKRAVFLGWLI